MLLVSVLLLRIFISPANRLLPFIVTTTGWLVAVKILHGVTDGRVPFTRAGIALVFMHVDDRPISEDSRSSSKDILTCRLWLACL